MQPRDPITVLMDMRGAFDGADGPRAKVLAVRDAMLTPRERELVAGVPDTDERTDDDFVGLAAFVGRTLDSAMYTDPRIFFSTHHHQIGQEILRPCEIAAINRAHREGTF